MVTAPWGLDRHGRLREGTVGTVDPPTCWLLLQRFSRCLQDRCPHWWLWKGHVASVEDCKELETSEF